MYYIKIAKYWLQTAQAKNKLNRPYRRLIWLSKTLSLHNSKYPTKLIEEQSGYLTKII